jgi:hypothetical protein
MRRSSSTMRIRATAMVFTPNRSLMILALQDKAGCRLCSHGTGE